MIGLRRFRRDPLNLYVTREKHQEINDEFNFIKDT